MFVYILELLENNLLQDSTFSKLITAADEKLGKINKLFESLINLERKERPNNTKQIKTFVKINKEIKYGLFFTLILLFHHTLKQYQLNRLLCTKILQHKQNDEINFHQEAGLYDKTDMNVL